MPLLGRETLLADFFAGITGAVIVLPQGVAFALIAGLPPQYGLYTAIVTPIVAGLFAFALFSLIVDNAYRSALGGGVALAVLMVPVL